MLDRTRIQEILNRNYSYYDQYKAPSKRDSRLAFPVRQFLAGQVDRSMSLLDVGCGHGATLLSLAPLIKKGIGIDENQDLVSIAADTARKEGADNLEFRVAQSYQLPFEPESFDLVFSERGPLSGNSGNIQSGLRVLRPQGMIFAETVGDLATWEEAEFFGRGQPRRHEHMTVMEQCRVLFERNAVDIRLAADHFGKNTFPDAYAWLQSRCAISSYLGAESPYGLDPGSVEEFAKAYASADGSITLTTHTVWIAGVKKDNPAEYWEHQHFPRERES